MTKLNEISSHNPASCGCCGYVFVADDLLNRCKVCDELICLKCFQSKTRKCCACGNLNPDRDLRIFLSGNTFRQATKEEISRLS